MFDLIRATMEYLEATHKDCMSTIAHVIALGDGWIVIAECDSMAGQQSPCMRALFVRASDRRVVWDMVANE